MTNLKPTDEQPLTRSTKASITWTVLSFLSILPGSAFGASAGLLLVYEPILLLAVGLKIQNSSLVSQLIFNSFGSGLGEWFFHSLPLAAINADPTITT
jgi:hypothetical protein